MFVAKVIDGQIANTGKLADMYPNTSFPANGASDQWMADNNIQVIKSYRAYDKATQKLTKVTPYLDGGEVYDVQVEALTEAEIAAKTSAETARKEKSVRDQRDRLLAECDWVTIKSLELGESVPTEWATYRQALRDITMHKNFPDLNSGGMDDSDSDWPSMPE